MSSLTLPRNFLRYDKGEVMALKVTGGALKKDLIADGDVLLVAIQKKVKKGDLAVGLRGDEVVVRRAPFTKNIEVIGRVVKLMRAL